MIALEKQATLLTALECVDYVFKAGQLLHQHEVLPDRAELGPEAVKELLTLYEKIKAGQ